MTIMPPVVVVLAARMMMWQTGCLEDAEDDGGQDLAGS